ncbi:MAG: hypothetical protein JRH06_05615 [Deltaproteobacteria bacterium]|nr:hypothetical protein [Deltaproteobacteria bacterium]MBW2137015.1 hypothetical protein [Deltaproteobacteria bacterium]
MAAKKEIEIKLRGKRFQISPAEAQKFLRTSGYGKDGHTKGKAPKYFVVVGGTKMPIKQALKRIMDKKGLGLTILDITTKDAVGIFRRLHFPIVVEGGAKGSKSSIMKYIGMFDFEGSSVEDKRKLYDHP